MNLFGALWRDFETIDDYIVFTTFESGYEAVPLVLDESRLSPHAVGKRTREVHFESDDTCWIPWVGKGVRRAAFSICSPNHFLSANQ